MQGLPKGWKREEVLVVGLAKNKLTETIYISPEGTRIKTKKQLMEALGPTWNAPECFDFKTGQFSPDLLKEKQEKDYKKTDYIIKYGVRPIDYDFELPVRRAQWCGEMPLKLVRGFPSNKIEKDYPAREKDDSARPIAPVRSRPCQLLSEKRLQKMSPVDTQGKKIGDVPLPGGITPSLPEVFDDGEVMTRISSQLVSTKLPVQGQKEVVPKQIEIAEEGRNVNKALLTSDALQPLCTSVTISDKDIYAQEDKVRRTQLALAEMMKKFRMQQQALVN